MTAPKSFKKTCSEQRYRVNKGGVTAEMREVKMDQGGWAMVREAGRREHVHDPERSNRVSE